MKPLADRIRPKNLAEFIGQKHLVGKDKPIRKMIETCNLSSFILWGPPGCGKTTLAKIIAQETQTTFYHLSAVSAGKEDIRKIVAFNQKIKSSQLEFTSAKIRENSPSSTQILFLDEIHRFNKAQQDYLLPYVENGTIILIGATTENPSFEVISPLLSRCQLFILKELSAKELEEIINRGLKELLRDANTLSSSKTICSPSTKQFLIQYANGDARQALNLLETTFKLYQKITVENLKKAIQSPYLRYDRAGDEHYNTISAFIKSLRASDVDAALYYLARMIEAGEDPLFIARRLVIFASEDIGMAQPTALVVANAVFRACETIGYPECAINLAHGTVYLAKAKKDRSAYNALRAAQADVKKHGNLPTPLKLRNPSTSLMKKIGYGKSYQLYPADKKTLLPDKLRSKKYYWE